LAVVGLTAFGFGSGFGFGGVGFRSELGSVSVSVPPLLSSSGREPPLLSSSGRVGTELTTFSGLISRVSSMPSICSSLRECVAFHDTTVALLPFKAVFCSPVRKTLDPSGIPIQELGSVSVPVPPLL